MRGVEGIVDVLLLYAEVLPWRVGIVLVVVHD